MPFQRGGYKWGELFVFITYSHLSASEDKQPTANCRLEEVEKEKKNQRPNRDRITTSASPHTFCACVYAQSSFFCGEKIQTLIKRTRWRRKNAKIFLFLFFTNVNFFSLFRSDQWGPIFSTTLILPECETTRRFLSGAKLHIAKRAKIFNDFKSVDFFFCGPADAMLDKEREKWTKRVVLRRVSRNNESAPSGTGASFVIPFAESDAEEAVSSSSSRRWRTNSPETLVRLFIRENWSTYSCK